MSSKKKESSTSKRPVGRPTAYKPEYCQGIIDHCKKGGTFTEYAEEIGHHTSIFDDWSEKIPEFRLAKKKAKQAAENWMIKVGRMGMMGVKTPQMPNFQPAMWMFMMKARFGWREDNEPDTEDVEIEWI